MTPMPIPAGDPVPVSATRAARLFWPVRTTHARALEVNVRLADGSVLGANPSRRFLADRSGGKRYHVGIDLYCSDGDPVVAAEDGRIVNLYHFYAGTWALLVAHDGYVANYGEVRPDSLEKAGLAVGDQVRAGEQIGTVGRLNMIHFETYAEGTTVNRSWMKTDPRPRQLRHPAGVLLALAARGTRP